MAAPKAVVNRSGPPRSRLAPEPGQLRAVGECHMNSRLAGGRQVRQAGVERDAADAGHLDRQRFAPLRELEVGLIEGDEIARGPVPVEQQHDVAFRAASEDL